MDFVLIPWSFVVMACLDWLLHWIAVPVWAVRRLCSKWFQNTLKSKKKSNWWYTNRLLFSLMIITATDATNEVCVHFVPLWSARADVQQRTPRWLIDYLDKMESYRSWSITREKSEKPEKNRESSWWNPDENNLTWKAQCPSQIVEKCC